MKKVYVGPKQKTIENSKFFDYSITLFGDNKDNNISYQENSIDKILDFEYWNPDSNPKEIKVYNVLLKKIKEPCEIMAHDYKIVSNCKIPNNYKLICKNEDILIDLFNNKEKTRNLFNKIVPMLDYQYISGGVFNFNKISKKEDSDFRLRWYIDHQGHAACFHPICLRKCSLRMGISALFPAVSPDETEALPELESEGKNICILFPRLERDGLQSTLSGVCCPTSSLATSKRY